MGAVQNVFSRYEMKFLLNHQQFEALTEFLKPYAREDEYGRYTVGNTYYDTPGHDLVRRSLEKPVYKEKLRTRCYTVPDRDTEIFVELKKKYKGLVFKRRAVLTMAAAKAYLDYGEKPSAGDQILSEIDWFINLYHPRPSMYVAYDRIAMTGIEDPALRITFDTNIRWRTRDTDLSAGTWGKTLLGVGWYVLEVKTPDVLPFWLADKLSELGIYKTSFSKYGRCFLLETAAAADGAPPADRDGKVINIADAFGNGAPGGENGRKTCYAGQYIAADGR